MHTKSISAQAPTYTSIRGGLLVSLAKIALPLALVSFSLGCGGGSGEVKTEGSSGPAASGATLTEGTEAPELTADYVTGSGPKTLADAKGKVVIIDFWGTYCEPCKASFPKYQALADKYGSDLAIIAVSKDDPDESKEDDLKAFVKKTGVKFTILWDKKSETAHKYNPPGMPTSFIIGKDGKIAHVHKTYHDGDEAGMSNEIAELIK